MTDKIFTDITTERESQNAIWGDQHNHIGIWLTILGEEYGEARVKDFLDKNYALGVEEFNRKLLEDLDAFKEDNFKDDICLMNIEVKSHQSLYSLGSHMLKGRHKKNK